MTEPPSLTRGLLRGLTRRCPRCGSRHAFTRWLVMRPECPRCGLFFEREEGYWLGAVAINLVVTEALTVGALVIGIAVTWPDVPWTGILVVLIAANVAVPILFHPISRTLWVAMERHARHWHEPEPGAPGPHYPAAP